MVTKIPPSGGWCNQHLCLTALGTRTSTIKQPAAPRASEDPACSLHRGLFNVSFPCWKGQGNSLGSIFRRVLIPFQRPPKGLMCHNTGIRFQHLSLRGTQTFRPSRHVTSMSKAKAAAAVCTALITGKRSTSSLGIPTWYLGSFCCGGAFCLSTSPTNPHLRARTFYGLALTNDRTYALNLAKP